MVELYLDPHDDLYLAQRKIGETEGTEVTVIIPEGSPIRTVSALKSLQKHMRAFGKSLHFTSPDAQITSVIQGLTSAELIPSGGFVTGKDAGAVLAPVLSEGGTRSSKPSIVRKRNRLVNIPRLVPFLLLFFLLFAVGGAAGYVLLRSFRAEVVLTLKQETLDHVFDIRAVPALPQMSVEKREIPAIVLEHTVSVVEATRTTGRELIGEKATGIVALYNKTDSARSFEKGSKITLGKTSGEDLVYFLDEGVSVPQRDSVSSETSTGQSTVTYTYGKATVSVTAAQIGDNFNIKKGETFTVLDLPVSEFLAESDGAFKGGSKKEAAVVTAEDITRLNEAALARARSSATEALKEKAADGQIFAEEALDIVTLKQTYSHSLRTPTDEVSLTLEAKGLLYTYDPAVLKEIIHQLVSANVPDTLQIEENNYEVMIENLKVQNNTLSFVARLSGKAQKKFDVDALKRRLAGRTLAQAQSMLSSEPVISAYSIHLSPRMLAFWGRLPSGSGRVFVDIQ